MARHTHDIIYKAHEPPRLQRRVIRRHRGRKRSNSGLGNRQPASCPPGAPYSIPVRAWINRFGPQLLVFVGYGEVMFRRSRKVLTMVSPTPALTLARPSACILPHQYARGISRKLEAPHGRPSALDGPLPPPPPPPLNPPPTELSGAAYSALCPRQKEVRPCRMWCLTMRKIIATHHEWAKPCKCNRT